MHIEISPQDGLPIYRQIFNQIKYLIASGQLAANQELPPIRALAEQLLVTPNTVVKAYDALAADGLVYKRQGAGTFVAELTTPLAHRERKKILTRRVDALLVEASQLQFNLEEVIGLLQQRQQAFVGNPEENRHV